jgi:hypothetical protein
MQSLKKFYFGKHKVAVNTYIGGIGETINTPALLASKLGINVNRIKLFKVTGVDIECAIISDYSIVVSCWQNQTDLTSYVDIDGKVTQIDRSAFYGCINLTHAEFTKLTVIKGGSASGAFQNCVSLLYVTAPKLTSLGGYTFNGCKKLQTIDYPLCTVLAFRCFELCSSLTLADFPNVTEISYYVFNGNSKLKTVNIPNCTKIGVGLDGRVFYNCISLETVYAPKCTIISSEGNSDNFVNIKIGCIITVNVALQTNNYGAPDGDLQYAITSRGAIVNYIT